MTLVSGVTRSHVMDFLSVGGLVVLSRSPPPQKAGVTVAAGFEGLASELFEVGNEVLTFG